MYYLSTLNIRHKYMVYNSFYYINMSYLPVYVQGMTGGEPD